jgi:hypothetical protein
MAKLGISFPANAVIDTLDVSRKYVRELGSYRLLEVARYLRVAVTARVRRRRITAVTPPATWSIARKQVHRIQSIESGRSQSALPVLAISRLTRP